MKELIRRLVTRDPDKKAKPADDHEKVIDMTASEVTTALVLWLMNNDDIDGENVDRSHPLIFRATGDEDHPFQIRIRLKRPERFDNRRKDDASTPGHTS